MKKGKTTILIIFTLIILVVGTTIITILINNKNIKEEIVESKKNILSSNEEYFITLQAKNEYLSESIQAFDLDGIKDRAQLLIDEVTKIEKEIDEADWCSTKSITYNADCKLYKEDIKYICNDFKNFGIRALNVLEGKKITEESKPSIKEKFEEFTKRTKEFMEKKYN